MKKIALITVSILTLGVAAVAADSLTWNTTANADQVVVAALPASEVGNTLTIRSGAGIDDEKKARALPVSQKSIRLVTSPSTTVTSCEEANWPYYPVNCLARVESAGL